MNSLRLSYALQSRTIFWRRMSEGPQVGGGVFIPPDTLERAQQAAEATGEAIADFLARAVETQAKRDRSSLAMGISPATKEKEPGN